MDLRWWIAGVSGLSVAECKLSVFAGMLGVLESYPTVYMHTPVPNKHG